MAPPFRWRDWTPEGSTAKPERTSAGFAGASFEGISSRGETGGEEGKENQQNQQKSRFPSMSTRQRMTERPAKPANGNETSDQQNLQKEVGGGVEALDRVAELCARHHLGQYAGTSVGRRLDSLFAAPLDQLDETTRALLVACEFLQIDGSQVVALTAGVGRQADGPGS